MKIEKEQIRQEIKKKGIRLVLENISFKLHNGTYNNNDVERLMTSIHEIMCEK